MAFYEEKRLEEMSRDEWESLCDGCGRCCLHRFEDEGDGTLIEVPVACRLLDVETCRCGDYSNRKAEVPSCVVLSPATLADYPWLPDTCAYRCVAEDRPLPKWHHLRTNDLRTVHEEGVGVAGQVVSERDADPLDALFQLIEASKEESR